MDNTRSNTSGAHLSIKILRIDMQFRQIKMNEKQKIKSLSLDRNSKNWCVEGWLDENTQQISANIWNQNINKLFLFFGKFRNVLQYIFSQISLNG